MKSQIQNDDITYINANAIKDADQLRKNNHSYTAIVRTLKWWRNYKELNPTDDEPGLCSFAIELIVGLEYTFLL